MALNVKAIQHPAAFLTEHNHSKAGRQHEPISRGFQEKLKTPAYERPCTTMQKRNEFIILSLQQSTQKHCIRTKPYTL
jgi:hypothetical protein